MNCKRTALGLVLAAALASLSLLAVAPTAGAVPQCDEFDPAPICGQSAFSIPVGAVDDAFEGEIGGTHQAGVYGWASDDDAEVIAVRLYVNGVYRTSTTAYVTFWRGDPHAGHRFVMYVPVSPGVNTLCVEAVNEGGGADVMIGCSSTLRPLG